MNYGSITAKDLWADAVAFCEHELPRLGYDEVSLELTASRDRFQALVDWSNRDA